MKFSSLYETYEAMREPGFRLKVDGTELETGEDARLLRVECELTSTGQAGMLRLEAALNPDGERGAAWLDAVRPGALCSLALGYGDSLTDVFCGFFYDVLWNDPLDGGTTLLEALCLDVRGRLMLTSCADAGAKRTLSQLVEAILGQSCCAELASKRTVSQHLRTGICPSSGREPPTTAWSAGRRIFSAMNFAPLRMSCTLARPGRRAILPSPSTAPTACCALPAAALWRGSAPL